MAKKIALFVIWLAALCLRKFVSFGVLIGSSYFLIVTPLLGSFLTLGQTSIALAGLALIKLLFNAFPVTFYLPTIGATLSWASAGKHKTVDFFLHVLLPITCIMMFITHPVGNQAAVYSLYWLIPVALWAIRNVKNISSPYIFALQSTFIAHALGSIMYLYAMPMTPGYWLALIPLVAVERLTIAGMSTLIYHGFIAGKREVHYFLSIPSKAISASGRLPDGSSRA